MARQRRTWKLAGVSIVALILALAFLVLGRVLVIAYAEVVIR